MSDDTLHHVIQWSVEKIDAMLEEKTRMSEEVMASGGEGWITELDHIPSLLVVAL